MSHLALQLAKSMVGGRMAASRFLDVVRCFRPPSLDVWRGLFRSPVQPSPALELAGVPVFLPLNDIRPSWIENEEFNGEIDAAPEDRQDHLWFAVPKKQVTRHKKRLKTTVQKRIALRNDITLDPRTGQITRKHRLPANWKDYLLDPSNPQ